MEKTSAYDICGRPPGPERPQRSKPSGFPQRFPCAALLLGAAFAPFALACPAYGQQDERTRCVPDIGKEVVTRADILRHGFYRLSDVLTFSAHWTAASLDGYHWRTAPPGFPDGAERWSLYIDDIPAAPRTLGRNRLNTLPVSLADAECVEIISGMDMEGPAPLREGVLRIYTKQPPFGLSLGAGVAAGNEINDPGPFRYTLPETINIDRIGPVRTANLSVGEKTWRGHASGRLDEHHVTDAALYDRAWRLYNIPDTKPHILTRALGFAGAFGRQSRPQRILAGFAHTGDMAFFPETGLEIPVTHRLALWGAAGRLSLPRGVAVRYAASSTRDSFGLRMNTEDIDLDWTQRRFAAEADLRARRLRMGGRFLAFRGETAHPLRDATLSDLRLFGGWDGRMRSRARARLFLEWIRREGRSGAVAYASADVRTGTLQGLRFAGSYGASPPDPGSLWLWQDRGYPLPYGSFRSPRRNPASFPRRATLDAGWMRRKPDGLTASAFVFYRGFRNDAAPEYSITRDGEDNPFDAATRLLREVSGHTGGVSVSMTFRPSPMLRQRISGAFEAVRRGSAGSAYGGRSPRLRLTALTEFTPASSFSLSALIQYVSAMRWPEYRDAAPETWRLAPRLLANATASKRMAGDRLNVSMGLRNMLNEPMRFHPAGAVFYMEFYFSASMRFTSSAGF